VNDTHEAGCECNEFGCTMRHRSHGCTCPEPAVTSACDCDDWYVGHIHTPNGIQPIEDDDDE
jgi:hypothetical protein